MNAARTGVAACALATLIFGQPAAAQALDDHYWLEAAAYWPSVDTKLAVTSNNSNTIGTEIDLESDLNLDDDKALPSFVAGARLGSGISIIGEYYSLHRSGSASLQREITFNDVTYPVAAGVTSSFDTDIYRLSIGYAFARGETYEIGASLGLHATKIVAELAGQGSVGNQSAQLQTRSEDVLAPLPTIGLFGTVEVMPRLTLGARVDYLSLKIDQYDGELLNAQASIVYRAFKNVGIGVAYRSVNYKLDVERERITGHFEYEFNGPSVFLQLGF